MRDRSQRGTEKRKVLFGWWDRLIACCVPTRARIEWQLLTSALLIVCAIWAFAAIAEEVVEGETRPFDRAILEWFRDAGEPGTAIGPTWFRRSMSDITSLGDIVILTFLIGAVAGWLFFERKRAAALLVVIATVTGQLVSSVLKVAFDRERPDFVPHLTDVMTASFPSGHSMMAAVVYLTLGALLMRVGSRMSTRIYTMSIAVFITVMVGISRVYLGVHYPTDVLAGWLVGFAWALVAWNVARYLQKRGAVETPASEESGGEEQTSN